MSTTVAERTPRTWLGGIASHARNRLLDRCGSVGTHRWRPLAVGNVGTIRPDALPGVLELHTEIFNRPSRALTRCYRLFPHTFYIVEEGAAVIGFCTCIMRPALSRRGLVLKARILSIGVHQAHRRRGVARRMLERCMAEMAGNGIASVDLYVDRENQIALSAYARAGLQVVDLARDICRQGKICYRMERTFPRVSAV